MKPQCSPGCSVVDGTFAGVGPAVARVLMLVRLEDAFLNDEPRPAEPLN
jgi:hypothetical protein